MDKKQLVAMIIMPLLAVAILFGASSLTPKADVYEGVGQGYDGEIKVKVSIIEDQITQIDIIDFNDTPGLGDKAAEAVIENILDTQSTDVDTVSGATLSSEGTIEAVSNALEKR